MHKEFIIGFILYRPTKSTKLRIEETIKSGFSVLIYDNSPEYDIIRKHFHNHENVTYITGGKNLGLGIGLSTICSQAYYNSYKTLLFFDQDTIFATESIRFIEMYYKTNRELFSNYSAVVFNSSGITNDDSKLDRQSEGIMSVQLVRNSGCLYNLDNLKKINWHDTTFFVDGVDYELCLRSACNNMLIGECSDTPGFDHSSEQGNTPYYLFKTNHALRKYSFVRIKDTTVSSFRIIQRALFKKKYMFLKRISTLLVVYLFEQASVRIIICWRKVWGMK